MPSCHLFALRRTSCVNRHRNLITGAVFWVGGTDNGGVEEIDIEFIFGVWSVNTVGNQPRFV